MNLTISVPPHIVQATERLAAALRISRNQLFVEALEAYLTRHEPEAITAQLNEVYEFEDSALDETLIRCQSVLLRDSDPL